LSLTILSKSKTSCGFSCWFCAFMIIHIAYRDLQYYHLFYLYSILFSGIFLEQFNQFLWRIIIPRTMWSEEVIIPPPLFNLGAACRMAKGNACFEPRQRLKTQKQLGRLPFTSLKLYRKTHRGNTTVRSTNLSCWALHAARKISCWWLVFFSF